MQTITATSVSRSVRRALGPEPLPLRVLAVFEHACDLIAEDSARAGGIIALVTPEVGDGPLNLVIDAPFCDLPLPPPGARASIDSGCLLLGGVEVTLGGSDWDPRPDWSSLRGRYRARYPVIAAQAPRLARLARSLAPNPGLLQLGEVAEAIPSSITPAVAASFQLAMADLPHGQVWPAERVARAAVRVLGLGQGLTPCGDDWLAGLLLWAWLAHPFPAEVGAAVVQAAAPSGATPRTTALSMAFLRCAAAGECDAAWQQLLHGLAAGRQTDDPAALGRILAHGATSGADMLAGFLYPLLQASS